MSPQRITDFHLMTDRKNYHGSRPENTAGGKNERSFKSARSAGGQPMGKGRQGKQEWWG